MLEREVTDVAISTLASFLLLLLILSPTENPMITLGIFACVMQISVNFLHLILKQLNRFSDTGSLIVVFFNAVCAVISFLAFVTGQPEPVEGFWSAVANGYDVLAYTIIIVNTVLTIISRTAAFVELD
ncbi:MAG: hypothetical protein ACXAE3_01055 [Candidatus Kariarchaeaceae archaeon]|jgi:hypothetical protein